MHRLEHRIPPPILLAVIAAVMWPLAGLSPEISLDPMPRAVLAACCGIAGLLIAGAGVGAFGRARTTINPVNIDAASALVTTGIFAHSRNPMYLGMSLLLAGWAIWLAGAAALLGVVVFVLFIDRFQIVPEERVLAAKFGSAYEDYRRAVRRWI